jgi:hypothetical protein
MLCSRFSLGSFGMIRPVAKVEKVHLYSAPVDFRKTIDGLAAQVAVVAPCFSLSSTSHATE